MSYKNPSGGKKGKTGKSKRSGGTSTGEYATQVYGGINEQHAGQDGSIAMKQVAGGDPMGLPEMKSGAVKSVGGNVLSDVAVPAALLYANHRYSRGRVAYGRRPRFINRSSNKKRRSSRRRRTFRKRR